MSELWERQGRETDKAFMAFCQYRDMPPKARSILAAYREYSGRRSAEKSPGFFSAWVKQYDWVERVNAYDSYHDSERLKETAAARRRVRILGWELLERQLDALKDANLTPEERIRLINSLRSLIQAFDDSLQAPTLPEKVTAGTVPYDDEWLEAA